MWTLILTTSTKLASISIFKDKSMKASLNINVVKSHSTYLVDEIFSLFKWLGIDSSSINNVIVSIGPGSFTGSRISLSFIKGMFINKNVKLYVANELDVLAYQGRQIYEDKIIALIDANKEKLYCAVFDSEKSSNYFISNLDDVINLIKQNGYIPIGDACINYREKLLLNGIDIKLNDSYLKINSENMMYMMLDGLLKEESLIQLKPFYLEKSQAEKEKKGE